MANRTKLDARLEKKQNYAISQLKNPLVKVKRAVIPRLWRPDSSWLAKGADFEVAKLRKERMAYARQDKLVGIQWLSEVFPEAVCRILAGERFTIDSFQKLGYYKYLVAQLNPICFEEGYDWKKAIQHNWAKKFCDLISLCHSIRDNGLTAPLDMFMEDGHAVLIRGYRRLEILFQLGVERVPVRVWRDEWMAKHFIPTSVWNVPGETVHGQAVSQFLKYGHKASDKYWVHGYTHRYDAHLQGRYREKLRILELGVKEGMSMDLWRRAFPRSVVFGIDIKPEREWKRLTAHERIHTFNLDYTDKDQLVKFAEENGPFDVIIDDGLHKPDPQRNAFKILWKYLSSNGVYVVEDLHPNYRGSHKKNSAMPVFKERIDEIWTNHLTKSVAFYPNIVFIEKA